LTGVRALGAAAALAAALFGGCGGQSPAPTPAPPASPSTGAASALAVEPASFDFGRVLPGRVLHKEFQLRNLGRATVAIDSVTTDCGCLIVGEYARQLAPGASTVLMVDLHTPPQPGALVRTLVVRTGGANPASLELRLRATVVGEGPGGA
jgi:hypothetical protein